MPPPGRASALFSQTFTSDDELHYGAAAASALPLPASATMVPKVRWRAGQVRVGGEGGGGRGDHILAAWWPMIACKLMGSSWVSQCGHGDVIALIKQADFLSVRFAVVS